MDSRPAPTFKKELYSYTAVDAHSRYIFTKLCPNRVGVIDHLESLRLFVASSGKILAVIRTDNEFLTSAAVHWAKQHNIIFKVSIPFEHDTVRVVERTHRTLQEMTVKALAFKPHLSSAYWGMAYEHCALITILHLAIVLRLHFYFGMDAHLTLPELQCFHLALLLLHIAH